MSQFKLPDLGEGLPDAEIREWYVKVGDTVKTDDPLVSMETAKAVVDVPAPYAGKIKKLHGEAGDVIETGSVLVEFESDEKPKEDSGTVAGKIEVGNEIVTETAKIVTPSNNTTKNKIKASPAVRSLAQKMGIELASLQGSGPNGLITIDDVKNANNTTENNSKSESTLEGATPLRGSRRIMAQIMSASHSEVVPVTIFDQADISHWTEATDITAQVITAIVAACKAEPNLNMTFDGKSASTKSNNHVNLGLATDSPEGLFVPVIKKVDALCENKSALREKINQLKQQISTRDIPQEELQDATITLSNFGMFAGRFATPVVVQPQVAIIGTGKIHEQVLPKDGQAIVGKVLPLSLTFDHRAVTGGEATRFMAKLIEAL